MPFGTGPFVCKKGFAKRGQDPFLTRRSVDRYALGNAKTTSRPKAALSIMPSTGRAATGHLRQRRRLCGLRAGLEPGHRPVRYAAAGLLPDADHFHLLFWPREEATSRRYARADHDPHPSMARLSPDGRHRTSVSGPLQVVPGAVGRAFSHSGSGYVERNPLLPANLVERRRSGSGGARRLVGQQGQGEATDLHAGGDLNVGTIGRRACQPAVRPKRTGGDASQHAARSTVRIGVVVAEERPGSV